MSCGHLQSLTTRHLRAHSSVAHAVSPSTAGRGEPEPRHTLSESRRRGFPPTWSGATHSGGSLSACVQVFWRLSLVFLEISAAIATRLRSQELMRSQTLS